MKWFLLTIFFLGSLLTSTLLHYYTSTNAQTPDYSKAYQNYITSYNLYRDSHTKYLSAKNEYLSYRTLNAETKALEATRTMLQGRDETLQNYLRAIRLRLEETTAIQSYKENVSYVKLDSEIGWLEIHKNSVSQANSLEDLLNNSLELEKKYPSIELLSYQALGMIISSRENSLRERTLTQIDKVDQKINQMKTEGENVEKLQRWLAEAKKKAAASSEKQGEAEKEINDIKTDDNDKLGTFSEAQALYEQSNQLLKEAGSYLGEIIDEIKYGQ